MIERRVEDYLDHLDVIREEVIETITHKGEQAVIIASIERAQNLLSSELTEDGMSNGAKNRYLVAVALAESSLEDRCDRHDLCSYIIDVSGRLLDTSNLHCRIIGHHIISSDITPATSPKILTGQNGDAIGLVILDGHPSAIVSGTELGIIAHELGHLFWGVRSKNPRSRSDAHIIEHLADAAGQSLFGPRFSRDISRYFARRQTGDQPLWGSHPDRASRLAFLRSAIEKTPPKYNAWTTWGLTCLNLNSTVRELIELPAKKALKYLEPHHPFTAELRSEAPKREEVEMLVAGTFNKSAIGDWVKDATDCKCDST